MGRARVKSPMPHLYIIRHGETEWSLSGRHTGRTDIPLTTRGEAEARALQARLGAITFVEVQSSPLQRARHTCELTGLSATPVIEPDLAEWDYGAYEGLRSSEIHQQRPDWSVFRDGCPGGESSADISNRADRLIARLRSRDGNIALFTHGHFACALAARWIDMPVIEGQHLLLSTASISMLGYHPTHPEVPVISLWNEVVPAGNDM
jgi:probable phosphoglycerate mutase